MTIKELNKVILSIITTENFLEYVKKLPKNNKTKGECNRLKKLLDFESYIMEKSETINECYKKMIRDILKEIRKRHPPYLNLNITSPTFHNNNAIKDIKKEILNEKIIIEKNNRKYFEMFIDQIKLEISNIIDEKDYNSKDYIILDNNHYKKINLVVNKLKKEFSISPLILSYSFDDILDYRTNYYAHYPITTPNVKSIIEYIDDIALFTLSKILSSIYIKNDEEFSKLLELMKKRDT